MALYTGESGHTLHTRTGLHQDKLRAEDPNSVLWEHAVRQHGAVEGDGEKAVESFKVKLLGAHKSPSLRLINEAIEIETQLQRRDRARRERKGEEIVVMNSVKQWFQPSLVRVRANQQVKYS